jgi:hypothetical protein
MDPEIRLRRAAKRYAEAKAERDQAIRDAAAAGMTRRAIAAAVGVSFQRVQQIVRRD